MFVLVKITYKLTFGYITKAHLTQSMPVRLVTAASQRLALASTFSPHTAEFVAAAGSVLSIPRLAGLPEVVVTGRANVGKSTLLNAVMKRKALVASSKKPGRTKTLTFFRIGPTPGRSSWWMHLATANVAVQNGASFSTNI
ncbi:hypothetical protein H4582DRAFT_397157 [Lactarius indigo]|nr:hypothetical protein H4582DRAFT_397157 [Lactarius indigo]